MHTIYIVYCLPLQKEICRINKITTNKNILKLIHACPNDVLSFQRDFNVYFYGAIDIQRFYFEAANVANISNDGLVQLATNCVIKKDETHANWTEKPISDNMMPYA